MSQPNENLPPLWVGDITKARSTVALALTIIQTLIIGMGYDASSPVDVSEGASVILDGLQMVLPAATALWLWYERRAPHYRLVIWRSDARPSS